MPGPHMDTEPSDETPDEAASEPYEHRDCYRATPRDDVTEQDVKDALDVLASWCLLEEGGVAAGVTPKPHGPPLMMVVGSPSEFPWLAQEALQSIQYTDQVGDRMN